MNRSWSFGAILLFFGAPFLHGHADTYSPCVPWEARSVLLLNEYDCTRDGLCDCATVPVRAGEFLALSVTRNKESPGAVGVLSLDTAGQSWRLDGIVWPYLETIHAADLNADGRADLILSFENTGCGIAGERTDLIVLLSSGKGYSATLVDTWNFNGNEVSPAEGGSVMLHCEFVFGDRGTDGRVHNYWLHRRLRIRGPEIRLYTFRPNHSDSDELSPDRKAEIIRENPVELEALEELPSTGKDSQ